MKTKNDTKSTSPAQAASAAQAAAKIHHHEQNVDAGISAAGGVSGAAIGAVIGSIAGPPGAIAGAVVGGAIGAASAYTLETEKHRVGGHDSELDEEIGVTSNALGANPVANVPEEEPPSSAEVLTEMEDKGRRAPAR